MKNFGTPSCVLPQGGLGRSGSCVVPDAVWDCFSITEKCHWGFDRHSMESVIFLSNLSS